MTRRRGKLTRIGIVFMVAVLLSALALSATAAPVTGATTVPSGQSTFSIDIYVNESTSYAAIEFALTISDESAVTLASFTPKLSGAASSPSLGKDGKHYFGFMSGSNSFPSGNALAGTLNFTGYTGSQTLTIEIVQMKVIRIDGDNKSIVTEKESPAYIFTVARAGTGTSYTVTFVPGGNYRTGGGELVQTVPEGGAAVAPVLSRSGYTYTWDRTFNNVRSDLTVTAIWTATNTNTPPPTTPPPTTPPPTTAPPTTAPPTTMPPTTDTPTEDVPDPEIPLTPTEYRYIDVTNPNKWYFEAVYYLRDYGLMFGIGNDTFSYDTPLTRAMFVTILGRLVEKSGETTTGFSNPFHDVPAGRWYTQYVAWGADKDIVRGYSATKFGPNDPVTREQMAVLLVRYADYMDIELKDDVAITFSDAGSISVWARESVDRAVAAGLMQGHQGMFKPLATATRAEVAQLFMNFVKAFLA